MEETSLTDREIETVATYNVIADEWASARNNPNFRLDELDILKSYLPKKGSLLEVGVGGGRDVEFLTELCGQYTGIDVSAGLLAVARDNNPNANLAQANLYALPFADDAFDVFWSAATLFHIPEDRIEQALQSLHRVTKNKGIGFISIEEGVGEYMEEVEGKPGLRRLFVYYSFDKFEKILNLCGYEIVSSTYRPLSKFTTYMSFVVRVIK